MALGKPIWFTQQSSVACECSTHFNIKVVKQLAPFLPPACWLAPRLAVWKKRHGAYDRSRLIFKWYWLPKIVLIVYSFSRTIFIVNIFRLIVYIWEFYLNVYLCPTWIPRTRGGQKVSNPLELEIQMAVFHNVSFGNRTLDPEKTVYVPNH